jgi:soluble lytic murein transglycosylase-like protein
MIQGSVLPKDRRAFLADMETLVDRFPGRRLGDDALYQLAAEHLFGAAPDLERALAYFERLRALEGTNDWLDSAYFYPAVGLFDRGRDGDLGAADRLLAEYLERFPDGVFRRRCLFWRGRIAERGGDAGTARALFEQVVREAPYDYYGLRASQHLEAGAAAASIALPAPDSELRAKIRHAYRQSLPDVELAGSTLFHDRLRTADDSGLLARLLPLVGGLGQRYRSRLEHVDPHLLDTDGLIAPVALLLSLRQDALAARDADPGADNSLRLAGFLGPGAGDWPLAVAMTTLRSDAPHAQLAALQTDPRYLGTVYPAAARIGDLRRILAGAAWEIEGSTALSESLMYAVARRESSYYPGAISPAGALGLFQIMPATFENRPECWGPDGGDQPTPTSYLFNPARNANFWACLVRKEYPPRDRGDLPVVLLKHHAGGGNLREWSRAWEGRTLEHDLELQIEYYVFPATRLFVRSVLADLTVVEATEIFTTSSTAHS